MSRLQRRVYKYPILFILAKCDHSGFVPLTRLVRYKVLSEETGDVAELLSIDGKVPAVMKLLPSEEFALSALSTLHSAALFLLQNFHTATLLYRVSRHHRFIW